MTTAVWSGFFAIFLGLLWLDLGILHREARVLQVGQAVRASLGWVAVALAFSAVVYGLYEYRWLGWEPGIGVESDGRNAFLAFVTGYLLEWSLSVDNIFVIALIFSYLRVPPALQYRVLFWGIVGAIVLRGAMIAMGTALIHTFDWMFYVFGAILLISAARMLGNDEDAYDPGRSLIVRMVRSVFRVSNQLDGQRFFTREAGRLTATPLFIALILVDVADVVFAVDSIPAILAVTQDPFLVFTSNAFAILGLRAMYFAIAGLMAQFQYLKYSLVLILAFVGVKMMLALHFHISNLFSLGVILVLLAAGILVSLFMKPRAAEAREAEPRQPDERE